MSSTSEIGMQAKSAKHTPGPWEVDESGPRTAIIGHVVNQRGGARSYSVVATMNDDNWETEANARLIAAAPELLIEAKIFRCLASSPRFQNMTVADALHELKINGQGHDDGAALMKAGGAA